MIVKQKISSIFPVALALLIPLICMANENQSEKTRPSNDEQIEKLANCAATHANNVTMLRAIGRTSEKSAGLADWFFEKAVGLSNYDKTKEIFSARYTQYVQSFKEIDGIEQANKPFFVNRYLASMNRDMDRCDELRATVDK